MGNWGEISPQDKWSYGTPTYNFGTTPHPGFQSPFFQISHLIHPFWVICHQSTYVYSQQGTQDSSHHQDGMNHFLGIGNSHINKTFINVTGILAGRGLTF